MAHQLFSQHCSIPSPLIENHAGKQAPACHLVHPYFQTQARALTSGAPALPASTPYEGVCVPGQSPKRCVVGLACLSRCSRDAPPDRHQRLKGPQRCRQDHLRGPHADQNRDRHCTCPGAHTSNSAQHQGTYSASCCFSNVCCARISRDDAPTRRL